MSAATLQQSDASIRKAAVLVRSLDADAVASLLARLSPAEARAVRLAVRELDDLTEEEQQAVAEDLRQASRQPPQPQPALEPRPALPQPVAPQSTDSSPATPEPRQDNPRLHMISQADPESLVACLSVEQPATVAVVLSCLTPQRAAEVLGQLPESLQSDAVHRLTEMGDIDPESLDVIAGELEAWIAKHTQDKRRREDRLATLQAIMDAATDTTRSRLEKQLGGKLPGFAPAPRTPAATLQDLDSLAPADAPPPPEPESIAPPQPAQQAARRAASQSFGLLADLPTPLLAETLRRCDRDTLMLALAGASDDLMAKLKGITTKAQFRSIERSLRIVGPVRLSDIEHAQSMVAEVAGGLLSRQNGGV